MLFNAPPASENPWTRLPKVELHVHLDCCLSLDAVCRLVPGATADSYQRDFVGPAQCRSLAEFLRGIDNSLALLQTEKGLQVAVEDLFDQFQADHVIYGEIRFAPGLHLKAGLSLEQVVDSVTRTSARCAERTGIATRIILCTLRHFSAEMSLATARLAVRFHHSGVAALDLAADEAGFPLDNHIRAFEFARQKGLAVTAHAGEALGADSVRQTLALLQPTRLGHGVRSAEDEALVAQLREQGVHLEVCPSCNVQTGIYSALADHPVHRLWQAGVSIGINTDARTLTNVTLSEEYRRLSRVFGWGPAHFQQANRNALEAAFIVPEERSALLERLEAGSGAAPSGKCPDTEGT